MSEARPTALPLAPALALAAVQFCFVTCWTVYVVYLPQLAARAGIGREWVPVILLLDQAVFAAMDLAMGTAADRVRQALRRIGPSLAAVTIVSCLAFAALPYAASAGVAAVPLSIALLLVWTTTASALRAPPWLLLARYAAQPRMPLLAAINLTGLALAAGIAPWLAIHLRGLDPTWPFVLASLALVLTTLALVAVERRLPATQEAVVRAPVGRGGVPPGTGLFVAGALVLGVATQLHLFVNSAPQYLRFVDSARLELYLPSFWLGFNLAMFAGAPIAERVGPVRLSGIAALTGLAGALLAASAPSLAWLVCGQIVTGAGWGCVLMAGFTIALRLGAGGREGLLVGSFWAALSIATLCRMGAVASGATKAAGVLQLLPWVVAVLWVAGALMLHLSGRRLAVR